MNLKNVIVVFKVLLALVFSLVKFSSQFSCILYDYHMMLERTDYHNPVIMNKTRRMFS